MIASDRRNARGHHRHLILKAPGTVRHVARFPASRSSLAAGRKTRRGWERPRRRTRRKIGKRGKRERKRKREGETDRGERRDREAQEEKEGLTCDIRKREKDLKSREEGREIVSGSVAAAAAAILVVRSALPPLTTDHKRSSGDLGVLGDIWCWVIPPWCTVGYPWRADSREKK